MSLFNPFAITGSITGILALAVLVLKVLALVDALRRKEAAFVAADKQTKQLWLIILGLALLGDIFLGGPIGIISLAGTIAAIVYIVDVRPAVSEVERGGGRRMGPYGPY